MIDTAFGQKEILSFRKYAQSSAAVHSNVPRRLVLLLVVCFMLFLPVLAHAQEIRSENGGLRDRGEPGVELPSSIQAILEASDYSKSEIFGLQEIFKEALELSIPAVLLVPKLQEGIAKGIPAARLSQALKRDLEYLDQARRLIERLEGADELIQRDAVWQRTAHMLLAGVEESEVASLLEICVDTPSVYRAASILYVSLKKWGLTKQENMDLIEAVVRSPIPPDEYIGMIDLFRLARARRIDPDELITRIQSHAPFTENIQDLHRRIID